MKDNDCNKCPYHGSYYDSLIGDGDEWCECGIHDDWARIKGCRWPLFIRHILAWTEKRRQAKYDRQAEKAWEKELEEMYSLRMDEEEYYEYKYGSNT